MKFNKEGGQALLIIVLIMVVALTVGLSLGSRTIINIRTASEEADSQKALAAAEAGIERAVQINEDKIINDQKFSENITSYNIEVKEAKGTTFLANGGNLVVQDDGVDVWLVSHSDGKANYSNPWTGDKLTIYWGDPSVEDCSNAAIEIAVISRIILSLDLELKRFVFDPCGSRREKNKFDNPGGGGPYTVSDKQFKYEAKNIDVKNGLVARVVPIYASTPIAVDGNGGDLPTQGFAIDSTGISGSGDRQVQRSLTFFRTFDQVATPHFMYGLFTPE